MSDKISKTIQQYKDFKQLQEYACAQETTILQMSKKIQALEEKVKHSEDVLKNSVGVPTINNGLQFSGDDAEIICQMEIAKLKTYSLERDLTLEENRKFDIYYKILNNINSKSPKEREVTEKPTDDLLKLVESKDGNGN